MACVGHFGLAPVDGEAVLTQSGVRPLGSVGPDVEAARKRPNAAGQFVDLGLEGQVSIVPESLTSRLTAFTARHASSGSAVWC